METNIVRLREAFRAMTGDLYWSHGESCPLRYNVNLLDACTCGVDEVQDALDAALCTCKENED